MRFLSIAIIAGITVAYVAHPVEKVPDNYKLKDVSVSPALTDNTYDTKIINEYKLFPKLSDDIVINIVVQPEITAGTYYYQYNHSNMIECTVKHKELYTMTYIMCDDHTPVYPVDELTVGMVGQLVINDIQATKMGLTRDQLIKQGFSIVDDPVNPDLDPDGNVKWIATINFKKAVGVGKRF